MLSSQFILLHIPASKMEKPTDDTHSWLTTVQKEFIPLPTLCPSDLQLNHYPTLLTLPLCSAAAVASDFMAAPMKTPWSQSKDS